MIICISGYQLSIEWSSNDGRLPQSSSKATADHNDTAERCGAEEINGGTAKAFLRALSQIGPFLQLSRGGFLCQCLFLAPANKGEWEERAAVSANPIISWFHIAAP